MDYTILCMCFTLVACFIIGSIFDYLYLTSLKKRIENLEYVFKALSFSISSARKTDIELSSDKGGAK